MALRIPVIDRQVSVPGDAGQPRVSPQQAGAVAGQVSDAAFGLARQADQLDDRIRQQRDVVDVSRALADARLHWVRRAAELEAAAPADGAGHEQALTAEFQAYQQEQAAKLSPTARAYFATRLEGLQSSLLGRALEFERVQRVTSTVNAFADAQAKSLAAVYQDARQFEPALGDLRGLIAGNAYLPAAKKDELLRRMESEAASSLLSGMIDRGDLDAAKARIGGGEFNQALGPRGLNAISDQLQRAFDRREAQAAAAERSRLAQLAATVRAGIRDDMAAAELRGAGAGRGGAWLVPDDQIRAVYDPDQAEQLIDQRAAAVDLHTARLQLRTASPEEREQLLAAGAPKDGPGFARASRRYGALLRADAERSAAVAASPGDWVFAADAGVAQAFADAQGKPGGIEAAARLTLQVQERMGIPEHRREVLGKTRAAQLAAQLNAATPDEAVKALDRDGLPRQYGEHWPLVYAELQRNHLAGAVVALPLVTDPVAKSDLAIAVRTPVATLKAAVTPDQEKDLAKALDSAMVPLRRSLGLATDGAARGNDIRDAVHRLSLRYVGMGQSPADAVKAAYDRIVGDHYQFDDRDGFRLRGASPADARRAVEVLLTLTSAEQLQAPRADGSAQGQLPDDERRRALLEMLRAGQYVLATNERDDGLVLLDRTRTPVLDRRGQRIEIATRNIPMLLEARRTMEASSRAASDAATEAERAAVAQSLREAGAAALRFLMAPPDGTFRERFQRAMTQPQSSWSSPAQPLTEPIDVLDVARRAFQGRDFLEMSAAEQERVLRQLDRTDPRLAERLRARSRSSGAP